MQFGTKDIHLIARQTRTTNSKNLFKEDKKK